MRAAPCRGNIFPGLSGSSAFRRPWVGRVRHARKERRGMSRQIAAKMDAYTNPRRIDMQNHAIVSREEWLAARRTLLVKEKEATRLRDKINAERLALPWVKVDKAYVFDTPQG